MGYKYNPFTKKLDITVEGYSNIEDGTTEGQMIFWDGSIWTYTETHEVYWDDTKKYMGIGIATPTEKLHVDGNIKTTGDIHVSAGQKIYFDK